MNLQKRKSRNLPDIVDAQTRSRMMAGIKGKNTKPELLVRKGLHSLGFRFRLHSKDVAGKPDLVFRKYRAVLFVNGCFWHGHNCHLFRMPSTRTDFWEAKINRNRQRDQDVRILLREGGWRRLLIWECALKGKTRLDFETMIDGVAQWLRGPGSEGKISGGHT